MPSDDETTSTRLAGTGQHRPGGHPEVWMPSAPPGESPPEAVEKTKAVAELLARLGPETEPRVLAEHLKRSALDISLEEVTAIQKELRERAAIPPRPDQPPPQKARRPGVGEPDEGAAPSGVPGAACPRHPTWTAARTAH